MRRRQIAQLTFAVVAATFFAGYTCMAPPPEDGDEEVGDLDAGSVDTVEVPLCENYTALREDALDNGTVVNSGVSLEASTPIADILGDTLTYDGMVVQIEGFIVALCDHQGCWAALGDPAGNQILLKVTDGIVDFRTITEPGYYGVGEGVFIAGDSHGSLIQIDNFGAMLGTIDCGI